MGNIIFWAIAAPVIIYIGITSFIDMYKQQKDYKNGNDIWYFINVVINIYMYGGSSSGWFILYNKKLWGGRIIWQ